MIGGAIAIGRAIAKGAGAGLELAGRGLRWLGWKRAGVLALLVAIVALAWIANGRGHEIDRLEDKLEVAAGKLELEREARKAEIASHRKTKADYREAQAEAERLELERLAAAKKRQEGITNEISSTYERNLAVLRARASRLQSELELARGAANGAAGSVALRGVPHAPGRAHETADARFSGAARDAGAELELDLAERLDAAELALQLNALLDWIEEQAKAAAPE